MATTSMDYENANGDRYEGMCSQSMPCIHQSESDACPPTADRRPRALDLDHLLHQIDSPSIIDTPNNADLSI